jgi:hypothetical protein
MSRPVVALGSWERLVIGTGWVREDLRAYRASLADRRLTVWGLFSYPERSHSRLPKFSRKPPLEETFFFYAGPGHRARIRLTEYPHA